MNKNPTQSAVVLAVLILLSAIFYYNTLDLPPAFIHSWTQADKYALVLGFLDNGLNFFKPRTYNLMTREGITGVDFPVHEYLVAWLMKLSGSRNPAIFRCYVLLWSIAGHFFFFRLVREASGSFRSGLAVALFLFSCPIIVYYQAGFLPSSTAFSTALIGYYWYFRYDKSRQKAHFQWSIAFLALSVLVRTPFHIFLFAVATQEAWRRWRGQRNRFVLPALVTAYACIFAWTLYKNWLTRHYGSLFLDRLMPAGSGVELLDLIQLVWSKWHAQFFTAFHAAIWLSVVGAGLLFCLRQKKLPGGSIAVQGFLATAGGLAYFPLMARQFVDHEYYFLDCLYLGPVLLLAAGMTVLTRVSGWRKNALHLLLFLLLAGGVWQSRRVQDLKYATTDWDRGEATRRHFRGADQLLNSLGVPDTAKMLVIDAYSFNLPLIMMRRRGYTVLATTPAELQESLERPFDYAVIQNAWYAPDVVANFPEILSKLERVGGNADISILRRRRSAGVSLVEEHLGVKSHFLNESMGFQGAKPASHWQKCDATSPDSENPGNVIGVMTARDEFGPLFLVENLSQPCTKVLFEGRIRPDEQAAALRVAVSLNQPDGSLRFYADQTVVSGKPGEWKSIYAFFDLPSEHLAGNTLKCYVWNPDKHAFLLDDFRVAVFEAN